MLVLHTRNFAFLLLVVVGGVAFAGKDRHGSAQRSIGFAGVVEATLVAAQQGWLVRRRTGQSRLVGRLTYVVASAGIFLLDADVAGCVSADQRPLKAGSGCGRCQLLDEVGRACTVGWSQGPDEIANLGRLGPLEKPRRATLRAAASIAYRHDGGSGSRSGMRKCAFRVVLKGEDGCDPKRVVV